MTAAICEPLQALSRYLDSVRGTLSCLDDVGITRTLREIETVSRQVHSVMLEAVAEADARGIAAREGFGNTTRLLAAMLRLSATEARTRVEQASLVGTRRNITGQPLAPRLPVTAAALAAGTIGTGQLRVITETMATLPISVPEPVREQVEAALAGYAADFDPRRLRIIAHRMLAVLDPDGPEPTESPTPGSPVRGELWLRERRDGRLGLEGWLDPEHGALVRSLIEQLAAPQPTADGMRDERTVPQRQADALIEQVIADAAGSALAHLPSASFPANAAWAVLWAIAHNPRPADALAGPFHARATTATLRAHLINIPARLARSARVLGTVLVFRTSRTRW